MNNQLVDAVNSYSFRSVLKTNIISNSGSTYGGVLSNGIGAHTNGKGLIRSYDHKKLLSSHYLKLQELNDYENNDLTTITLGIYEDYLKPYFNFNSSLVTLSDSVPYHSLRTAQINKVFDDLDIVNCLSTHIRPLIYQGSYSVKIKWDAENHKFLRYDLANPGYVVKVRNDRETYLVTSRDGSIYEVNGDTILYFGDEDVALYNDLNPDYYGKDDTLVAESQFVTGTPLYYDISNKIKEYILKDQILTFLSIKDLIQPLLLLIRVDNKTAPDEANKLALNTENLINKYSDISAIMGANFSINDLMDSLINNIRVLPDYQSGMGDMGSIDMSKIAEKIDKIRGDQEQSRDQLLNTLSIPRSLFSGEVTKWEAIKSSQRLNNRISRFMAILVKGIEDATIKFHRMITGEEIARKDIKVNLFNKSDVDYNIELSNAEIISNVFSQVSTILESATNTVKAQMILNPDKFYHYVRDKLISIDSEYANIITDDLIMEAVAQVKKERAGDEEGGEGGGPSDW